MSEKTLKICPFCGMLPVWKARSKCWYVFHRKGCFIAWRQTIEESNEKFWQTRVYGT